MLEVRDLHVKFHNRDREAVAGVSFTLKDGEILGGPCGRVRLRKIRHGDEHRRPPSPQKV